jgi:DNA-binding PadR family transcriptional regulator
MALTGHNRTPRLQPLTPAVFHILLTLADGPKHGYAIMKQVNAEGGGWLRMGPGTLYGTLQRMLVADLIKEIPAGEIAVGEKVSAEKEDPTDERRRYYRLTAAGRRSLGDELVRLNQALRAARKKGLAVPAQHGGR